MTAYFASTKNSYFVLVALLPIAIFWFLDAYYLTQERKFRGLYDDVAGITEQPRPIKSFAMRPDLYTGGKYVYWSSFTSVTIVSLYLPIFIGLLSLFVYSRFFTT